ncbi:hypothetical protein QJ854_gp951 [Moumouvirus goulette]|uniref:Uncharacterized protein n=1 Tax=Moumouvirus goulette TaxID=1247379 RepID=M1PLN5_9VIRU|nr:hypothetical protein QJ854_gp951 [Moumouvirus goulette]AGF84831.1 hypothetical protein glt_00022 [Moumouvirus goulette]
MQFDFKNGGVYKLDKDLRGYKKVYCSPIDSSSYDFKQAILTLRIAANTTVVVPSNDHGYGWLNETDVDGIMKTDKVYVEKIEDLAGDTIGDDFKCRSSKINGPQNQSVLDSNGLIIGGDVFPIYSGSKYNYYNYKLNKKYQAHLSLNHDNITGSGYFFYSTKEQAKKSAEYY